MRADNFTPPAVHITQDDIDITDAGAYYIVAYTSRGWEIWTDPDNAHAGYRRIFDTAEEMYSVYDTPISLQYMHMPVTYSITSGSTLVLRIYPRLLFPYYSGASWVAFGCGFGPYMECDEGGSNAVIADPKLSGYSTPLAPAFFVTVQAAGSPGDVLNLYASIYGTRVST